MLFALLVEPGQGRGGFDAERKAERPQRDASRMKCQRTGRPKGRPSRGRSIMAMGFEPAVVSERPTGPPG